MTLEPILEVCHLSKSFGTHQVLRDVNFTVHPGDVTSILGSSGSGKSTLLRCINLLERPNQGRSASTAGPSPAGGRTPPLTGPGWGWSFSLSTSFPI